MNAGTLRKVLIVAAMALSGAGAAASENDADAWADIALTINPDGTVKDVRLIKSSGGWVDQPAVDAVSKWRYRAPGREIRGSRVHVTFCLEQEPPDPGKATDECREQRAKAQH